MVGRKEIVEAISAPVKKMRCQDLNNAVTLAVTTKRSDLLEILLDGAVLDPVTAHVVDELAKQGRISQSVARKVSERVPAHLRLLLDSPEVKREARAIVQTLPRR